MQTTNVIFEWNFSMEGTKIDLGKKIDLGNCFFGPTELPKSIIDCRC